MRAAGGYSGFLRTPDCASDISGAIVGVAIAVAGRDALNACQHAGQRHSARCSPFAAVRRIMRQPKELMSVWSVSLWGDVPLQSTHVS